MDTHITDIPGAVLEGTLVSDSSSHAGAPEHADADNPDQPRTVRQPRRTRPALTAGAAAVVLAAGGVFLLSSYNTLYPINTAALRSQGQQLVSSARQEASRLMAPSAKVASMPAPGQATRYDDQAAVVSHTREQQVQEIVGLHDRTASVSAPTPESTGQSAQAQESIAPIPPPVPVRTATPPNQATPAPRVVSAAPAETRSKPATAMPAPGAGLEVGAAADAGPAPADVQPPVASLTVTPAPEQVRPREATPDAVRPADPPAALAFVPSQPVRRAEPPTDPVERIAKLQAAPMTTEEQVRVLDEVARLAIVVRDMRAENAALKARVESTADRFDHAVVDFTRRLALAEAHGSVDAAMGAGATSAAITAPTGTAAAAGGQPEQVLQLSSPSRPASGTGTRVVPVSTVLPGQAVPVGPVRYHVTAASPGLAMLATLDRSGGEGTQLQVAIGDQVPGYGRVTVIQQRGTAWVVQTDKGPDKGAIQ